MSLCGLSTGQENKNGGFSWHFQKRGPFSKIIRIYLGPSGPESSAGAKASPGAGSESSAGATGPSEGRALIFRRGEGAIGRGASKECQGEAPPVAGSDIEAGAAGPAGASFGPRSSLVLILKDSLLFFSHSTYSSFLEIFSMIMLQSVCKLSQEKKIRP